jgi:hypothetical protein
VLALAVSKDDQDFWLDHKTVDAWESVALSLDINPRSITQTSDGFPNVRTLLIEHRDEFDKRLKLLTNVLVSDPQHFTGVIPHSISPVFHSVRLLEVVTWLSSRGRTSPDWLLAAIAPAPPIHVDDSGISRQVEAHLAQRAAAGLDDDDDEYDPDEFREEDTTQPEKQRRHYLDPIIERAIAQAGGFDPAHVWIKLREMAVISEPPLMGTFQENTGAIEYTDSRNRVACFTRKALQQRLKRWGSR